MEITSGGRIACLVWSRLQYPAALLILATPGVERRGRAVSSRGGWCRARLLSDGLGEVWKVGQEIDGCFGKRGLKRIYNLEHKQISLTVCFENSTSGHSAGGCQRRECQRTVTLGAHYECTNFKTWYNCTVVFVYHAPFNLHAWNREHFKCGVCAEWLHYSERRGCFSFVNCASSLTADEWAQSLLLPQISNGLQHVV